MNSSIKGLLILLLLSATACGTSEQGLKGNTGTDGVAGPSGSTGATGPEGPRGPQGIQGVPGAVGPEGPAGPEGPEGPTGPMGPAGASGPQGPMGPQGLQGAQGPAGSGGALNTRANLYSVTPVQAQIPANSGGTATAYCHNTKDIILNGGCFGGGSLGQSFTGSLPVNADNSNPSATSGWQCDVSNLTSSEFIVTVYATCVSVP